MIRKANSNQKKKRRRKHGFWNMSRAVRGSVTLLLVMLLLPMITFSTLIIDASRLQSVRTNIAGAGDLTLNAIMSEYNVLLEDMYGLFANCKNMNDLKPALEAYFRQSAESFVPAGTLSGNDYAKEMIKKATNLVLDNNGNVPQESLTNFLNMALVDNQFQAEAVHGGALANPNIMKQQIVEYMKYRGPVSLASTLLGKLNVLSNASSQTDACDKKVDYNKSLGALKDPCTTAFQAIEEKYNMGALVMNLAMSEGMEGTALKGMEYLMGENSAEIKGLDEIIARSKYAYENATIFYLLNAKSPFREKGPDYNDIKNQALAESPVDYRNLDRVSYPENATAEQKVAAYQATLNAIEGEYTKLIQYGGGFGQYEQEFDNIHTTQQVNFDANAVKTISYKIETVTDDQGRPVKDDEGNNVQQIVYTSAPVQNSFYVPVAREENNKTDEHLPTFHNLNAAGSPTGIAPWHYLFEKNEKEINPSDSLIDQQIEYGRQMLEMQEEIKNGLFFDGIKKYIVYKERVNQLSSLYAKYADQLYDLRTDYFYETVRKEVIEDEENLDKEEQELRTQMEDKWEPVGKEQIGEYMRKKAIINACTSAMSKNETEIQNWLGQTANNERFFLRYANQYNEEAYSTIFVLGQSLEIMKEGLDTLSGSIDKILDVMKDIEDKKELWKESIDKVDSDSTRAAMLNDYSTAIDKLDKAEIEKLKNVVNSELKPQVEKQLQMVKSVKYLDQQLYNVKNAADVIKDESNKKISEKIEEKIKNKLLQGILKGVSAKANEQVWKLIDDGDKLPVFPDFSSNGKILSTQYDLNDNNSLKSAAKDLVKNNYDSSGFVIKDFKRFRVLDGINDKKAFSAYDSADMEKMDVIGNKEKVKNNDPAAKELIDPDEAFVITLYAEFKASKAAAAQNGGGDGNGDAEPPKNQDQANLEKVADKGRNDAKNGTEPAQPQQQQQTGTTAAPASEKFGDIMKTIEGYCKQNEPAKEESAPDCPNSSINNKKPADSAGGDGLKNANNLLSRITDLGNVILQNVYLEEYMTEMFTCRTDNQQLNKLTAQKDKDVLPVILLNGYTNQNARASYNSNANASARTGRFINENTEWYGREIEYLLFGKPNPKDNMLATDGTIFAIRFALNAIYAFTAPDIQSFALEVATAIAGWTVIGVPIVQACITILIALAESGYDIYLLHDGKNVPIYKNASTFVCCPGGLLKKVVEEAADQIIDEVVDRVADKVEEELDKGVDKIVQRGEDMATKKVSDYANDLKQTVKQYGDQQKQALKSAVCNMFVTPILNNIVPVESLIVAGDRYKTADPTALIEEAVKKAFEQAESTLEGMDDSAAKRVAKKLLEKSKQPMISTVTQNLKKYFETPEGSRGSLSDIITEMFLGKTGVPGFIDQVSKEIEGEIDKIKDTINDNIVKYGDMAGSNVKDFMHEQFDNASEQISGHLKNAAKNLTDKIPGKSGTGLDTGATSGGFSLTYKEYCKVLMMIFICTSENQILQRAAVLITANMRHPYPNNPKVGQDVIANAGSFDITNANTLFSVSAQVKMKTLFPWGVQDNQGDGNTDTGLKLDLSDLGDNSIKINYCGINGY